MTCRCDSCGKFRKESDVIIQEDWTFDNMVCDQWVECRYCMSQADEERYFKQESKE